VWPLTLFVKAPIFPVHNKHSVPGVCSVWPQHISALSHVGTGSCSSLVQVHKHVQGVTDPWSQWRMRIFGTIVAERGVEYRIMVSVFIRKRHNFVGKGVCCLSVTCARHVYQLNNPDVFILPTWQVTCGNAM
jgi:hypothetical protein